MNDPAQMTGPADFAKAASLMNFVFNWSYIDSKHIAYQLTGWFPRRARGTSPDFPILGTGKFDWKGFDPSTHEATWLPQSLHPHAVDQPFLVSWNNKQARGWAAADDKFSYGPVFRSQMIEQRVKDAIAGGKVTLAQLVQSMEEPASQDLQAWALMPILRNALGNPSDPRLRQAINLLSTWAANGAHRRDLDRNGSDEDSDAIALMDAWWPRLVRAEFGPALGDTALVGSAEAGDDVVVNVAARDLGLGSGGFDIVHVNLSRGLDGGRGCPVARSARSRPTMRAGSARRGRRTRCRSGPSARWCRRGRCVGRSRWIPWRRRPAPSRTSRGIRRRRESR